VLKYLVALVAFIVVATVPIVIAFNFFMRQAAG
jgi:hypothetical protein